MKKKKTQKINGKSFMRDTQSTKQGKYERGNAMSTTQRKQAKSTNERDKN